MALKLKKDQQILTEGQLLTFEKKERKKDTSATTTLPYLAKV